MIKSIRQKGWIKPGIGIDKFEMELIGIDPISAWTLP